MLKSLLTAFCLTLSASHEPPSPQEYGKQLATVGPEIERMIEDLKFGEASVRAESLLPTTVEPYNGQSTTSAFGSALAYYNYARAYFLAFKAADTSGEWEKALTYVQKAQELARTNKTETEKALTEPMKAWEELRDSGKKVLDANASRIAELKAKENPTNAELNELDDYISAEKNFKIGEESAKTLLFAWDRGTKYAKSYDAYVDYMQAKLDDQAKEISAYAPAKGDKVRWAEAIAQAPSYLKTFTENREKVAFLYRLTVLAPESSKVKRALDIALGRPVLVEQKSKPTKKK